MTSRGNGLISPASVNFVLNCMCIDVTYQLLLLFFHIASSNFFDMLYSKSINDLSFRIN